MRPTAPHKLRRSLSYLLCFICSSTPFSYFFGLDSGGTNPLFR